MANEFLTDEQRRRYGRFDGDPDETQLTRYFHLDNTDRGLINNCRGDYNRLGFALQLSTVRFLGTFMPDVTHVPRNVLHFVARQLAIADVDCLTNYQNRDATRTAHRIEIQNYYGYRDFSAPPWRFRLTRLLYSRAWISNERPSLMFDVATACLIQNKVLLPGATLLQRLIIEIRERATERLWLRLAALPTLDQKEALEKLLDVPHGQRVSRFDRIGKGPVTVSGPSFVNAVGRYSELRQFGLAELDFSSIPPVRLKAVARYASMTSQYRIARMPDHKRVAILLAFVRAFEISALDDALDVLDLLISNIAGEAKLIGRRERLRTLKDLDKAALVIAEVCELIVSEEIDSKDLRDEIFARVSKEQLAESITAVTELARPPEDKFHKEMVAQYGRVKLFLQALLQNIRFESAPAGEHTLDAFDFLTDLGPTRKQTLDEAPLEIVSKLWQRLVYDEQGRTETKGYTLCFLDKFQDSLRRRDVYAPSSDRWGDPRAKLLGGDDWRSQRIQVCRSLGHPVSGGRAIGQLVEQLDASYRQVAANFDANIEVHIDRSGAKPTLTIGNLDKLEEPDSLKVLRQHVGGLLPKVDLTELVLEIIARTGFVNEFTHVSETSARVDDLHISICAVLLAEACNIGLEPLAQSQVPALTRHRLSWVKQNYVRAETLTRANACLVDYHSSLALVNRWGGGDVASADGLRFVTPVKTIHAGYNPKYFKSGKGITWYNLMSDQFSGLNGIPIAGTLRDSIYVLEVLLEQQTGLRPTEIMTDTSGASDMIFGLFWLLGYQFSPRLADAGEARFWRVDQDANYGPLDEIASNCVDVEHAENEWEDMLRIAGSLKLGTIHASELIRTLLKSDRTSSLAKAIMEVGRINKTIYLLHFVDDESYRRRILTQLNRTEKRHGLARAIYHGRRGEIRKHYREGQEDQLGALGLVLNAAVLWNTIYMQDALDHLQKRSLTILEEDVARLSPLRYRHINMFGHYSFTLAEHIRRGEHRPLSQLRLQFGQDLESLLATLELEPEY